MIVTFTSENIKDLSQELQEELYEYLRTYGASVKSVKGHCETNLDEYRNEYWPKIFAAVPQKGDRVEARSGKVLRVVDITHTVVEQLHDGCKTGINIPYIIVELDKRY